MNDDPREVGWAEKHVRQLEESMRRLNDRMSKAEKGLQVLQEDEWPDLTKVKDDIAWLKRMLPEWASTHNHPHGHFDIPEAFSPPVGGMLQAEAPVKGYVEDEPIRRSEHSFQEDLDNELESIRPTIGRFHTARGAFGRCGPHGIRWCRDCDLPTPQWSPTVREGESLEDVSLDQWIGEALGAASMCWVGGTGDRKFDSSRAKVIADSLNAHVQSVISGVIEGTSKAVKPEGRMVTEGHLIERCAESYKRGFNEGKQHQAPRSFEAGRAVGKAEAQGQMAPGVFRCTICRTKEWTNAPDFIEHQRTHIQDGLPERKRALLGAEERVRQFMTEHYVGADAVEAVVKALRGDN